MYICVYDYDMCVVCMYVLGINVYNKNTQQVGVCAPVQRCRCKLGCIRLDLTVETPITDPLNSKTSL